MTLRNENSFSLKSSTSSPEDESAEQTREEQLKMQRMELATGKLKELKHQFISEHYFKDLDSCLTYLAQCRQSDYYQELAKNILNNTPLIAGELLYFALTTDNILQINHLELNDILKQEIFHYKISYLVRKNIAIMIHAIALSKAIDTNEKIELTALSKRVTLLFSSILSD